MSPTTLLAYDTPTLAGTFTPPARPPRTNVCPFTPHERDILGLIADGWTDHDLARLVHATYDATRSAISRMLAATHTHTRAQLVATALRNGWIK